MRVLVVSHNVFGQTTNMGKTLSAYFNGWSNDSIAQIYVHSGVPDDCICSNYYRITDRDMVKSIFTRKSGTIYKGIQEKKENQPSGFTASLYQAGRKRTPIIYTARNLLWRIGAWKTKKLLRWVDEFNPDVIFFASGDYSFAYRIALKLAKYKRIPMVVSCMDDYYLYNKNQNKLFGNVVHKSFMKQARKTIEYASCIFTICQRMSDDYSRLFSRPCYTLHTPSLLTQPLTFEKTNAISYIGNLGYKRNEQLVKLGRALREINCFGQTEYPEYIDVYSTEKNSEILKELTLENGIRFCGAISAEQVLEVMGRSMLVIHTESFDEVMRKRVAYSVSTKIADSLASGTCILAYGPSEVASIEYLKDNNAAYCITDEVDLYTALLELFKNDAMRDEIIKNAIELSKKNHTTSKNCKLIADVLDDVCKNN